MEKPADVFDRDHEWAALTRFATDDQPGAMLGVVSGRRRQGKTYLLDAVCRAAGGLYFGATEATEAESLRLLGDALTEHVGAPAPIRPTAWAEAIDALLALGEKRPVPVVLDEFPYLAKASPSLPSIIQAAYGPRRSQRTGSRTRLLLSGSAMSFMGGLLSGSAPLRGRAGIELVVHPFDHLQAGRFWGISDPRLAVRVNAVVGGTPAYRREFVRGDVPTDLDDFDSWITRTVLSPESPLFREARYLLAEEPDLRDAALYHSVLAAVASGNVTRGGIASYLGRRDSDLAHPLDVLEDTGLVVREADAFRSNRSTFRVAEPLITFYHAIMRPVWDQLARLGNAERVWRTAKSRFESNVLGPRFEQLCREWTMFHGYSQLTDLIPARVGSGVVNDPQRQSTHEVDVVLVGTGHGSRPPLLAIGEAKWGQTMGRTDLDRLRRILDLISAGDKYDIEHTRLVCFSGVGFTADLAAAERAGEVALVDLSRLYGDERTRVPPA